MEKRRRARINASLAELKSLLLEAIKKEGARHNKMEKADILEMAVKHLRQIQRQQIAGEAPNDPSVINKYRLGFHACAQEVSKYLGSNSDEDVELKTKLLNHLANCMTSGQFETLSSAASSSSSSSALPTPLSPLSLGSLSPTSTTLSPEGQSSVHTEGSSGQSSLLIKGEIPGLRVAVSQVEGQAVPLVTPLKSGAENALLDGILRTTFASTTNFTSPKPSSSSSLLVKPQAVSLSPTPGAFLQISPTAGEKKGSNDDDENGNNNNIGGDRHHIAAVTEINNNTITLPTFINVSGSTTLASLQHQQQHHGHLQQQQVQLQPSHTSQQQQHLKSTDQSQLQQHENAGLIANLNRLQLIPTKAVNGETVYVLSANLVNPAQFPNYAIPVLTPPVVNQAQVLAPPFPQQAIQIAVSYPQEERQQPVAFLQHVAQPQLQSTVHKAEQIFSSSHSTIAQQATPLNLSSSSHQSPGPSHPPITGRPASFARTAALTSESAPISSTHRITPSLVIPASAAPYSTLDYSSLVPCSSGNSGTLSQPYLPAALPSSNVRLFPEYCTTTTPSTSSVAIIKPHPTEPNRSYDDPEQSSSRPQEDTKRNSTDSSIHTPRAYQPRETDKAQSKQSSFFRPW